MSRSRILSSIAAASLGIALLGACSAEALSERAASYGLEQAIEGDQDIDLDFGQDGSGGFNISTDEGDFSLSFDEDGIVFNSDEGDGAISFDEDGIVFNTDEGDGVITFDDENGSINFDTDAGDGSINIGDNGDLTIDTEDGSLGIFNSPDAPASWPQQIAQPATLVAGSQAFSVLDLGDTVVTTGVFTHDPAEQYAATVVAILQSTGWEQNISSNQDGTVFAQLTNGDRIAQVVGDNNGYSTISITETK